MMLLRLVQHVAVTVAVSFGCVFAVIAANGVAEPFASAAAAATLRFVLVWPPGVVVT